MSNIDFANTARAVMRRRPRRAAISRKFLQYESDPTVLPVTTAIALLGTGSSSLAQRLRRMTVKNARQPTPGVYGFNWWQVSINQPAPSAIVPISVQTGATGNFTEIPFPASNVMYSVEPLNDRYGRSPTTKTYNGAPMDIINGANIYFLTLTQALLGTEVAATSATSFIFDFVLSN